MNPTRWGGIGSLKSTAPPIAAPTTPMLTQIAYAVPIGSVRAARASRNMLATMAVPVMMLGTGRVKPCVYLKIGRAHV